MEEDVSRNFRYSKFVYTFSAHHSNYASIAALDPIIVKVTNTKLSSHSLRGTMGIVLPFHTSSVYRSLVFYDLGNVRVKVYDCSAYKHMFARRNLLAEFERNLINVYGNT